MHNSLRNALSVKLGELVDKVGVSQEDRTILSGGHGVLVVVHRDTLGCGHRFGHISKTINTNQIGW